jgi:23S rRNA (uracil1939-C5)-methyltransferase
MNTEIDVKVTRLGAQGDGVAESDGTSLFVPYVLPGETVRVTPQDGDRAALLKILEPSPSRIASPCRHFRQCGGCAVQHAAPDFYAEWKHDLVNSALAARGIEAEIAPLVATAPRSRRRATFAATRTKKDVMLGYYARATHNIVAITECPLVVPEIEEALPALARAVAPGLSRRSRASLLVTSTENGLDVAVSGGKPLDGALRAELGREAAASGFARITWDGEIIAERLPPAISLSGLRVMLPPGGFLQPTREGEAALVDLVRAGVGKAKRIVDLYAGSGTFAAAFARASSVHAVEGEKRALAALDRAMREQGPVLGLKPVTIETRDLARRPLLSSELNAFDAVVIDPPRAGALAQAEEIARSSVPVVASVSCNPATFARDARALLDGGYQLERVTPVDQFLWSPHLEVVGIFRRA